MNVRELKEIIKDLPDDTEVVVRYDNDWGGINTMDIGQYYLDNPEKVLYLGESQAYLGLQYIEIALLS